MKKIKRIILILVVWTSTIVHAQIVHTFAGIGTYGMSGTSGPANVAIINGPSGILRDKNGNTYVSTYDNRIVKIDASGMISNFAGIPSTGFNGGFSGDGGPATAANLYRPGGMCMDTAGNLYVADSQNNRVRVINSAGIINTFAGTGSFGFSGDGGPAVSANVSPADVKIDSIGSVYIVGGSRVRKVDAFGIIHTIAGNGTSTYTGDGGPATSAQIGASSIAFDRKSNIYLADGTNYRIRKINTAGIISTICGTGSIGNSGDGGQAVFAKIGLVTGIVIDTIGNLYFADGNFSVIRKIDTSGIISTVAGTGISGFSGDGAPAINAQFSFPFHFTLEKSGDMYINDANNHRVRMICASSCGVSVNEYSKSSTVLVYPNPATNVLHISDVENAFINSKIEVSNYLGQTVLNQAYSSEVYISKLPAGIYTLIINTQGKQSYYTKFIKE